ncbi:MAG: phage major capsid protein [Endomicrobium sp.]|jgi:hypothetical protein|nr:phage major capsid protein [Endomicrobium sp.]
MPNFGYGAALFNDLWAATRFENGKRMVDMLGRSHPLLDKVARAGNLEAKEGGVGKRNVDLILARANNNVRWVTFEAEITPTTTNLLEQIEWDWKFCYQDFVIFDKMLSINKSDEIADLLDINQRALMEGFKVSMARQLYSGGDATGYSMGGLQYLLSANPYKNNLVVLNLPRGANYDTDDKSYEFWRNRAGEWTTTDWAKYTTDIAKATAMVEAWQHMLQVINSKDDEIDGIYTNYYFYNLYLTYMQEKLHINNVPSEKKDAGFASVEFMGVPVYLDKYCPNNQIYFINSKYLHFKYLEGENFVQEKRQIPTQFATQYITTFIGNFIIEKPRAQGVITLSAATNGLPDTSNICKFSSFVDKDYDPEAIRQTTDTSIERTNYSGSGVYRLPTPVAQPASTQNVDDVKKK